MVMPVENSMQKPQQFLGCPGVLNTAMTTVMGKIKNWNYRLELDWLQCVFVSSLISFL